MSTQPDTATSGPAEPRPVPNQSPAGYSGGKPSGFAATDVLVSEFDGGPDTVQRAYTTSDELQPHSELGLKDDEYERIRQILGRRPTASELAMYSIMWSEHCSYKSSKVHLRQFGEKTPKNTRMLAGIGENAGVVQISDELAVTFKVESHNHPSFVEPYQGAATGVGGIVRDILAMGARPIAVMDPLRFGAADHPDTARVLPGVVAGIGGYGNCLGLPNIGGEIVFDPCYQGNPLVNALSIGVLPVARLQHKEAAGVGNVVVLLGARTGRDGIGGVSVLASATFTEGEESRRPSVQVGDPFMEKLLIESCLELYDAGLVVGIQDLGGAGLTCALTETAAAAGTGMRVWLERVPLREASMSPTEILASESQERMLLIVAPEKIDEVLQVAEKWGVWATAIGEVTPSDTPGLPGRLVISWNDHIVVDVPPGSLADDGPVYARPIREPADLILLQADRAETLPRPATPDELRATLLRMIASPNLCDKTWVTEQYDRYVLGNTVLAQPEDAGVLRIDEASGLGVALSVDGNGRYTRLDPYQGARLALAEAYRNVVVTGAEPAAVTDCLNFGSPEDPAVMWQFAEAVRGLADGCLELGIPVTGGNVSFYNQTGAAAIHPTPVVGVLGILQDVTRRVPMGFPPAANADGDLLFLLGDTECELSGSEWAWVTHGHLGGRPPKVDLAHERNLGRLLARAAEAGHVSAAHDLSDGGLAQVLVESALRRNIGARINLPGDDPFVALFSESAGRAVVAVPRGHDMAFVASAAEFNITCTPIGVTTEDPTLDVRGQFEIPLDELRAAHTATMRDLFGGPGELANRHGDPQHAAHPDEPASPLREPVSSDLESAGSSPLDASTGSDAAISASSDSPSLSSASDLVPEPAESDLVPEPADSDLVSESAETDSAAVASSADELDASVAQKPTRAGRRRAETVPEFTDGVVSAEAGPDEEDASVRSVTLELTEPDLAAAPGENTERGASEDLVTSSGDALAPVGESSVDNFGPALTGDDADPAWSGEQLGSSAAPDLAPGFGDPGADEAETSIPTTAGATSPDESGADPTAATGDEPASIGNEPAAIGNEPASIGNEPAAIGNEPAAIGSESASTGDELAATGNESASTSSTKAADSPTDPSTAATHSSPTVNDPTLPGGPIAPDSPAPGSSTHPGSTPTREVGPSSASDEAG